MILNKFFNWLKFVRQKQISSKLDRKLIQKIRSGIVPRFSQLRYIGRFLSPVEKKIVKISALLAAIAALSWVIIFVWRNNVKAPASGGEYTEALIGQPKFINPLFANSNSVDSDLTALIYSGLFRTDETDKIIPDLAAEYTISEDKKTYDIKLRQDVKWSDGESFNADDVLFTFTTVQNPAVNSPLIATFQGIKMERTGEYAIRFTLKEPFAPFLSSLAIGILPEHIWRNIPPVNMKLAKNNLQPIGTGRWKFSKLSKDQTGNIQTYVLTPNKNYYEAQPFLNTLIFKFYPDYTQAVTALKSQDVMALAFVPQDLKDKISANNFNFYYFRLPQYVALFFNPEKEKKLKNDLTRAALRQAIDKDKIVTEIFGQNAATADSPIVTAVANQKQTADVYSFNQASSTALLSDDWKKIQAEDYFKIRYEALLKEKQSVIDAIKEKTSSSTQEMSTSSIDAEIEKITNELKNTVRNQMDVKQKFYWRDDDNNILKLTITALNNSEFKNVAEKISAAWRDIGAQTDVRLVEKEQINEVLKNRDYQILLYGEILGNDPDPFAFWHSSQINYPGLNLALFSNDEADKILEKARSNVSVEERNKLYEQFQKILAKEIPAIFLYTPKHNYIIHKQIKGAGVSYITHPSDRYLNINKWYVKTKKQWLGKKQ